MPFVGNLALLAAVEEICKSIKNWQSYGHGYRVAPFFDSQCSTEQFCR